MLLGREVRACNTRTDSGWGKVDFTSSARASSRKSRLRTGGGRAAPVSVDIMSLERRWRWRIHKKATATKNRTYQITAFSPPEEELLYSQRINELSP
jgi:hypothetical protein